MVRFLLLVHLLLAAAMVGVILLQRSEGSTLGLGGGSTGLMTGRQAGNLLTRITALFATIFMVTSLALAVLGGYDFHVPRRSILDQADSHEGRNATMPIPQTAEAVPPPPSTPGESNGQGIALEERKTQKDR